MKERSRMAISDTVYRSAIQVYTRHFGKTYRKLCFLTLASKKLRIKKKKKWLLPFLAEVKAQSYIGCVGYRSIALFQAAYSKSGAVSLISYNPFRELALAIAASHNGRRQPKEDCISHITFNGGIHITSVAEEHSESVSSLRYKP